MDPREPDSGLVNELTGFAGWGRERSICHRLHVLVVDAVAVVEREVIRLQDVDESAERVQRFDRLAREFVCGFDHSPAKRLLPLVVNLHPGTPERSDEPSTEGAGERDRDGRPWVH